MSQLKMFEWDVALQQTGKKLKSIPSQEVAIVINDQERYVISIDQDERAVVIKKVAHNNNGTIIISPMHSNKIYVK